VDQPSPRRLPHCGPCAGGAPHRAARMTAAGDHWWHERWSPPARAHAPSDASEEPACCCLHLGSTVNRRVVHTHRRLQLWPSHLRVDPSTCRRRRHCARPTLAGSPATATSSNGPLFRRGHHRMYEAPTGLETGCVLRYQRSNKVACLLRFPRRFRAFMKHGRGARSLTDMGSLRILERWANRSNPNA